jgi:hypothetical protein
VFVHRLAINGATSTAEFLLTHPLTVVVVVVRSSLTTPSRLNVLLMKFSYVRKSPNVTGEEISITVELVQSRCNTRAKQATIAKLIDIMIAARKPARVYNARRGFTRLTSCRDATCTGRDTFLSSSAVVAAEWLRSENVVGRFREEYILPSGQ